MYDAYFIKEQDDGTWILQWFFNPEVLHQGTLNECIAKFDSLPYNDTIHRALCSIRPVNAPGYWYEGIKVNVS